MTDLSTRYIDWKAPAEDSQMLIWPEPAALLEETRENARRLSTADEVRIQGVPLAELRRSARRFIGHDSDAPLIATGHQTELYHPGVWVKNAMINAIARRMEGEAYQLAVDTDAPKHLHLRWPGGSEPITDDEAASTAEWAELLRSPTPRHLSEVVDRFHRAAQRWGFEPSIEPFFDSMRKLSLESACLSSALTNSIHAVEWELGLRHHALVVSPLWQCEPYLVFAHHLMARCEELAGSYNAVLAEYRRRNGVRTAARPMPDLHLAADEIELPFWMDDLAQGHRSRASVKKAGGSWILFAGDEGAAGFELDPAKEGMEAAAQLLRWCRQHQVRLTPRALTLTMFFRLFLADQFVHGIGGARYDQVTDALIHEHFQMEPPAFSVTTATLYFPAAAGQRRIHLHPLLQEGRRLRHGMLSGQKRAMATRIDQLPRHSRERQDLFFQMHRLLADGAGSPALRQWEQRLQAAEQESHLQKSLFDRELFFAIQPRERLTAMVQRYDEAFREEQPPT